MSTEEVNEECKDLRAELTEHIDGLYLVVREAAIPIPLREEILQKLRQMRERLQRP